MKLIILEGADNVGKDTLIHEITKNIPSKNLIKKHWVSPKGNTNEEKIEFQKKSFNREFESYENLSIIFHNHIMIWNRSHIGELVYGKMYRDYDPTDWVFQLEAKHHFSDNDDIYLIYLDSDAEFLVNNDDGQSFSNKLQDKETELQLFRKAVNDSTIKNKLTLKINQGKQRMPLLSLVNQINQFIYEHS
jgi:thymidylate kinase